jgi:hypothetical protein
MLIANVDFHRVSFEMGKSRKRAFAQKCAVEGRSMTDIAQELVDEYLARTPRPRVCDTTKLYVPRAGAGLEENERY